MGFVIDELIVFGIQGLRVIKTVLDIRGAKRFKDIQSSVDSRSRVSDRMSVTSSQKDYQSLLGKGEKMDVFRKMT